MKKSVSFYKEIIKTSSDDAVCIKTLLFELLANELPLSSSQAMACVDSIDLDQDDLMSVLVLKLFGEIIDLDDMITRAEV